MKDELSKLFDDDPLDEEPDAVVEKVFHQEFIDTHILLLREASKKKNFPPKKVVEISYHQEEKANNITTNSILIQLFEFR